MFSKKLFNNNQNSSGGGSGGPTNWGSIGGDINNQIDLKGQLNGKADKTAAAKMQNRLCRNRNPTGSEVMPILTRTPPFSFNHYKSKRLKYQPC